MNQLVHQSGDRLIVTSLEISNHFGKRHDDVLKAVRNIECSQEFARRNFAVCSYQDGNQRQRPMYEITRDGFTLLCMGFTGPEAMVWKERYIEAFNQMEAALRQPPEQLKRMVEALAGEVLRDKPERRKLLRYRKMGLSVLEISRLVRRNEATVRREIVLMEACGLLQVTPQMVAKRALALSNLPHKGGAA